MDSSEKLDELMLALERFRKEIDSGMVLQTAFVSIRTSRWIDSIRACLVRLIGEKVS